MAAVRRLAERAAPLVPVDGATLRPFPSAEAVAAMDEAALRACGLSAAKARAVHAAAEAVRSRELREEDLEALPSAGAAERLLALPGIGPWSAALVLLRGLGRLDVFPAGDSGATRRLRTALPGASGARLLDALGPWRGMLYFHLLLDGRFPEEPGPGS
jgi:DNA-3-methyladenine glycosylase II